MTDQAPDDEPAPAGFPFSPVEHVRAVEPPRPAVNGYPACPAPVTAAALRAGWSPGKPQLIGLLAAMAGTGWRTAQVRLRDVYAQKDGRLLAGELGPLHFEDSALRKLDVALAEQFGLKTLGLRDLLVHPDLSVAGMVLLNTVTDKITSDAELSLDVRGVPPQAFVPLDGQKVLRPELFEPLVAALGDMPMNSYYTHDELQIDVWPPLAPIVPKTALDVTGARLHDEALYVGLRITVDVYDAKIKAAPIVSNRTGSVFASRPRATDLTELDALLAGLPAALASFVACWDQAATTALSERVAMDEPAVSDIISACHKATEAADWSTLRDKSLELLDGVHRWFAHKYNAPEELRSEIVMAALHMDPRCTSGARENRPAPTLGALANGVLLWAQQLEPLQAAQVERFMWRVICEPRDGSGLSLYWQA